MKKISLFLMISCPLLTSASIDGDKFSLVLSKCYQNRLDMTKDKNVKVYESPERIYVCEKENRDFNCKMLEKSGKDFKPKGAFSVLVTVSLGNTIELRSDDANLIINLNKNHKKVLVSHKRFQSQTDIETTICSGLFLTEKDIDKENQKKSTPEPKKELKEFFPPMIGS